MPKIYSLNRNRKLSQTIFSTKNGNVSSYGYFIVTVDYVHPHHILQGKYRKIIFTSNSMIYVLTHQTSIFLCVAVRDISISVLVHLSCLKMSIISVDGKKVTGKKVTEIKSRKKSHRKKSHRKKSHKNKGLNKMHIICT